MAGSETRSSVSWNSVRVADEADELLGCRGTRQRPEAGALAAGHDYGNDLLRHLGLSLKVLMSSISLRLPIARMRARPVARRSVAAFVGFRLDIAAHFRRVARGAEMDDPPVAERHAETVDIAGAADGTDRLQEGGEIVRAGAQMGHQARAGFDREILEPVGRSKGQAG
jgi:hypothetical protein